MRALANTTNPLLAVGLQKLQAVTKELRVSVDVFEVRDGDEIEGALGTAVSCVAMMCYCLVESIGATHG